MAEAALSYPLPPAGATLAATVTSLDTLTAMALLAMRADGLVISGQIFERLIRIIAVVRADCRVAALSMNALRSRLGTRSRRWYPTRIRAWPNRLG